MITTLIILAVTAVFFVIGKIRSDIVALCSLILLMAFGILTPTEALSGFSNSVVIMMVGLFVVGGAVFQTGLAKMISGKIMHLAGDNETRLFLLVMLTTTAIGAFVSNTGTVALMLPIVVSMAAKGNISASRLLMPLAFASSLGGMLTLIGTPPNLVIQEALANAGYGTLGFFSFTPVGIIAIAIGIIVLMPLSKWLLSNKDKDGSKKKKRTKSLQELVDEYHLADQLTRYVIPKGSELNDKTLMELDIQNRYNLSVMEIRREKRGRNGWIRDVSQKMAGPKTRFMEGDIIYLSGEPGQMERFATDYKLRQPVTKQKGNAQNKMDFYDIGIAELVIMPNTTLQNHKIKESGFRSKYNINIVAVRRNGNYILNNLAEVSLHAGDVLLVQGTWANISRLTHEDEHWVVLGQPLAEAEKVTLDYKAPLAAIIMLAMIAMMVFDFIPIEPVTAVMIAGVLMVLTGCFRNVEAAYKTINWETIVLIAAMMPMSVALEKTGASAMISQSLVSGLGTYGPYALLAGIYFTTSLLTMFISNTATAVLMAPIALSSALGLHLDPTAFLFAVSLGASMCFASPFSTPPNALVMQAGRYTFMDYVKVGLPLQIIIGIVMVFVLPLLFPF
ncbi:MAG TPA: SLC13 family permease [Candidatus Prevotella avicola]|uniref:SLC13 family permease n=1 Tax=Candidatus Prevotella avicola TaxID=2838738 RepID=A0A9D2FZ57_9BACT|nr:SLC13 family permease [Candidatus Prevotella avicola]